GTVAPADVARVRAATAARTSSWPIDELTASLPQPLFTDGWTVAASHNSTAASGGLTLTGWTSGAPQQAGMWFQFDLPAPRRVTEIQFLSPVPGESAAAVSGTGAPMQSQDPAAYGYPRAFKLEVSTDGATWTTAA